MRTSNDRLSSMRRASKTTRRVSRDIGQDAPQPEHSEWWALLFALMIFVAAIWGVIAIGWITQLRSEQETGTMFGNHVEELIDWSGYQRLKQTGTVTPEDLGRFPFRPIVSHLRAVGRWAAPNEGLDAFSWAAQAIQRFAKASPPSDRRPHDLVRDFCRIVAAIGHKLTYDIYVCRDILLQKTGHERQLAEANARQRLDQAVVLLEDLWDFERRTLAGNERFNTCCMPATNLLEARIAHIEKVLKSVGSALEHFRSASQIPIDPGPWLLASLLPQSTVHDEVAFIRTLHVFECECDAILPLLEESIDLLQARAITDAARAIRSLNRAAGLFVQTTGILGTLTPSSFSSFRDVTDGSSAVQLEKIKVIEAAAAGMSVEREQSAAIRHLAAVRCRLDSSRPTLSDLAHRLEEDGGLGDRVKDELLTFEQCFMKWKAVHFALAMKMFAGRDITGTGGTVGVAYLRRWRDERLFPWLKPY